MTQDPQEPSVDDVMTMALDSAKARLDEDGCDCGDANDPPCALCLVDRAIAMRQRTAPSVDPSPGQERDRERVRCDSEDECRSVVAGIDALRSQVEALTKERDDLRHQINGGPSGPETEPPYEGLLPQMRSLKASLIQVTKARDQLRAVAKALDEFQADYERKTFDTMPGNDHFAGKLMAIVTAARPALSDGEDQTGREQEKS